MLVRISIAALAGVLCWLGLVGQLWSLIPGDLYPYAYAALATLMIVVTDFEPMVSSLPRSWQPSMRRIFGVRSPESRGTVPSGGITMVVPAFNEEDGITATVTSIREQTVKPAATIVIDDGSVDKTSELARRAGATVFYRERNADNTTQGKAAGQIFGLTQAKTEFIIYIDGDTVLKEDALEQMMPYFNEEGVSAIGGYVLPADVDTIWGKLRQFQYHYGFSVIKPGQSNTGSIFVSSGCFTSFRTDTLRKAMRLQRRRLYRKNNPKPATGLRKAWYALRAFLKIPKVHVEHKIGLAEDQLYTWLLMEMGRMVRKRVKNGRTNQTPCGKIQFAPESLCWVHDPKSRKVYAKQGYRWNAGYFQNLKEYNFNLFPMGFWFAIFTYFSLISSLMGTVLEVAGLVTASYLTFVFALGPWLKLWLGFLGHEYPWPVLNAILTFYSYEAFIVASFVLVFVLGHASGLLVVFVTAWLPVMKKAHQMREDGRMWMTALAVFPFIVIRYLDVYIFYSAFLDELILGKRLKRWDKGHAGNHAPQKPSFSGESQRSAAPAFT